MGNKHRKLFVIGQSKGCKFLPQMHRNTFGSRALSRPAVGAYALARPLAAMGGLFLREREVQRGKGGVCLEGGQKGRNWNSPQSQGK